MTHGREICWVKRADVEALIAIKHLKDLLPKPMELLRTTLTGEQMARPPERIGGSMEWRELSPVADVPNVTRKSR